MAVLLIISAVNLCYFVDRMVCLRCSYGPNIKCSIYLINKHQSENSLPPFLTDENRPVKLANFGFGERLKTRLLFSARLKNKRENVLVYYML